MIAITSFIIKLHFYMEDYAENSWKLASFKLHAKPVHLMTSKTLLFFSFNSSLV